MSKSDIAVTQAIEIVDKNIGEASVSDNFPDLFPVALSVANCTICGAEFQRPEKSRREFCSPECKRERSIRYSAAYRKLGRDMLENIRSMFGGRTPTTQDIIELIQKRKGKP